MRLWPREFIKQCHGYQNYGKLWDLMESYNDYFRPLWNQPAYQGPSSKPKNAAKRCVWPPDSEQLVSYFFSIFYAKNRDSSHFLSVQFLFSLCIFYIQAHCMTNPLLLPSHAGTFFRVLRIFHKNALFSCIFRQKYSFRGYKFLMTLIFRRIRNMKSLYCRCVHYVRYIPNVLTRRVGKFFSHM